MENKKKKKDIINELLVDPTTYQYVNDDKRNTSNDYEVTSNKTTDQLSAMVDQPEDMYSSNLSFNSFFYENDDKTIQVEEVLKKTEIKDIVSGNNEQIGDKIIQIINNIKDDFNDQEKYSLIQELIKKLKIKELDKELVNKIIDNLKKADNLL